MKVSQLRGIVRTLEIKVPGDEERGEPDEIVVVQYRPGALDLDTMEKFEASGDKATLGVVRQMLEPLLVSWDIQKDDGSPLLTYGEDLGQVPMDFLNQVLAEITAAIRPDPQKDETSEGGSPPTGDSDVPQNGGDSSKQVGTFA